MRRAWGESHQSLLRTSLVLTSQNRTKIGDFQAVGGEQSRLEAAVRKPYRLAITGKAVSSRKRVMRGHRSVVEVFRLDVRAVQQGIVYSGTRAPNALCWD